MSTILQRRTTSGIRASTMKSAAILAGRVLLAAQFLISGFGKISAYSQTAEHMTTAGLSPHLLPLVILLEIAGASALIIGWRTRLFSLLLAAFTLTAGVIFHGSLSDPQQFIHLLKNVSIAGGFVLLAAHGAGALSLDQRAS